MASIDFGSTAGKRPYGTLVVNQASQDIGSNTSVVSWYLVLHRPSSISSSATKYWSVTINGSTYNGSGSIGGSGDKTLLSGSTSIGHNSDGTKSISFSASIGLNITWSGTPLNTISGSGSMPLSTIPRASSFSVSGNTIGSAVTVNISRASTSFTHDIKYHVDNQGWQTAATGVGTSYSFTLPMSLCSYVPNGTSIGLHFALLTYSGGTLIGSAYYDTTCYVPSNVVPSFSSISLSGVDLFKNMYLQAISKVKVTINGASGSYGSSIKNYSINGQSLSTTSSSATSGALPNGTFSYKGTITDSRGRTATKTSGSISVNAYTKPSCSFKVERGIYNLVNNTFKVDESNGTTLRITPTYSYTYLNGNNSLVLNRISSNGLTVNALGSGQVVYLGKPDVSGGQGKFSTDKSYSISYDLTDEVGYSSNTTATVPTGKTIMDFLASGDGVAFGKVAETNNRLDSAWPIKTPKLVDGSNREIDLSKILIFVE